MAVQVKQGTGFMCLNVAFNPFECCKYQSHLNALIELVKEICIPAVGYFSSWAKKGKKGIFLEMPTWLY